ncbi:LysR substrate-binding domain-containing protein [Streptomyces sp900116325]|uniref:LysR family transcriptional regulator n=1 Tax=Streptomyces sp. 900116325 TaxID=3154295 RepID=UPI0033AF6197
MDVDLRKLRYFVEVAEQLHFGRAAQTLHIAQPALSRQIRALEDDLGVALFIRDRRSTTLTPAGQQLLHDAKPLLASAQATVRRALQAALPTQQFTIAFMPGITVTPAVKALSAQHPQLDIRLLRTGWDNQTKVVLDGRADVSIVRMPVDPRGLNVKPLFTEPRVVVVADDNPLARKDSLTLADLADAHLLQDPEAVPEWRAVAHELRNGRRAQVPAIGSVEEKLELVASGAGFCVLPRSTASFYTRPDVAVLPAPDLADNQISLVWNSSHETGLVQDFSDVCYLLRPPGAN